MFAAPKTSLAKLLRAFRRPRFVEEDEWMVRTQTIQFYLGPAGSGAQPHWHAGSAWKMVVQLYGAPPLSPSLLPERRSRLWPCHLISAHGPHVPCSP